jgi:hypothetical protein
MFKKQSILIKSLAVIDSCETIDQLMVAHKYLSVALIKCFISIPDYKALTRHLYGRMPSIYGADI